MIQTGFIPAIYILVVKIENMSVCESVTEEKKQTETCTKAHACIDTCPLYMGRKCVRRPKSTKLERRFKTRL